MENIINLFVQLIMAKEPKNLKIKYFRKLLISFLIKMETDKKHLEWNTKNK